MSKLKLEIPDFVSIGQFNKWEKLITNKSVKGKTLGIQALTNINIDTIRALPPKVFNNFHNEVTNGLLVEELPILLIEFKGKVYGLGPFNKKTIGEVADTEEFFKQGDKTAIIKTILRNATSYDESLEWESIGFDNEGDEVRVVRMGDIVSQSKLIKLEEYDADKQLDDDTLLSFPYGIYSSIVAFMLGTGLPFMMASKSCSPSVQETAEAVRKFVQTEGSFRRLCILRKLGY